VAFSGCEAESLYLENWKVTRMGLFWDLIQQSQISDQQQVASSLEQRVMTLEKELKATRALQRRLLELLEEHFDQDINGDGTVGQRGQ